MATPTIFKAHPTSTGGWSSFTSSVGTALPPSITSHLPEPQHGIEAVSGYGRTVLWVIFAAMLTFAIGFFATSFRLQKKDRVFHYVTGFINLFAAISYYVMATGANGILVKARGHHAFREVLTARYADWCVTTPLLILDLGLFAGMSPFDIITVIVLDELMIVTGLLAAKDSNVGGRLGLYAFSCIFMIILFVILIVNGRAAARERGEKVAKAYLSLCGLTVFLWTLYPIVWILSEGLNIIPANQEVLFYGLLDAAAKPGFGILLLVLHQSLGEFDSSLPAWFVETGANNYSALPASD